MMYHDNFVAFVKTGPNKIAREIDGAVSLPFGTEYQLGLKNTNSTRAAVTVFIDDVDVLHGSRIIIDPNETCELDGFLNGNTVTHKFKFIEKTEQISEHRGDRAGDGLIRVEYQFEQKPAVVHHIYHQDHHWYPPVRPRSSPFFYGIGSTSNAQIGGSAESAMNRPLTSCNLNDSDSSITRSMKRAAQETKSTARLSCFSPASAAHTTPLADGITVKGSASDQMFKTGYLGAMEAAKHVITLKLMGFVPDSKKKVTAVVTTKQKIECETCGAHNKSHNKFCGRCGTALWG